MAQFTICAVKSESVTGTHLDHVQFVERSQAIGTSAALAAANGGITAGGAPTASMARLCAK